MTQMFNEQEKNAYTNSQDMNGSADVQGTSTYTNGAASTGYGYGPETSSFSNSQEMENYTASQDSNSKLLKGIVIGGIVGGALAMLDSSTRNQLKSTALGVKDNSKQMFNQMKENPGDLKEQMVSSFKTAADTLKDALTDAKTLYERVNNEFFGKMGKVMEATNDTLSTAKDAKGELKSIGSKVMDAGANLKETVKPVSSSSTSESTSGSDTMMNSSNTSTSNTGTSSYGTSEGTSASTSLSSTSESGGVPAKSFGADTESAKGSKSNHSPTANGKSNDEGEPPYTTTFSN